MELGEREGEKEGPMIEGQGGRERVRGAGGEREGTGQLFEMYEFKTYIKSRCSFHIALPSCSHTHSHIRIFLLLFAQG